MPLVISHSLPNGARLGVWRMNEDASSFPELYEEAEARFKSSSRRKEYVCVRALLREMNNGVMPVISHEPSGKPVLEDGTRVSISHTKDYCAVIVSDQHDVGVDIEYVSDRVGRIAHRFLRADETFSDITSQLICWCAKEAVYKLFSDDDLLFEEMFVEPFEARDAGVLMVRNLKKDVVAEVSYHVTSDYVLAYSVW